MNLHPVHPAVARRGPARAALLALLVLVVTGPAPVRAADRDTPAWVPGRLYLKLRATPAVAAAKASPALREALGAALDSAQPLARRAQGPLPGGLDRLLALQLPETTDIPVLARKLSGLSEVEYAEPVWMREIVEVPGDGPQAVPVLAQVGDIRNDNVHSQHAGVGEHDAAVDDDQVVAILIGHHVHAELA